MTSAALDARVVAFRRLHESGCFALPNPWSVGSAIILEGLGFAAVATTSSGFAWSLGHRDNTISLEQALDHFRSIAAAVGIPVNADFEGGFAIEPAAVKSNVLRASTTGVAGLSIEDSTGDAEQPLFDFDLAIARVQAAREAIDQSGTGVVLTARTEGYVVGRPDLDETIRRLSAFAEAGADCLYAPGLTIPEEITAVVDAVSPKPINVLARSNHTSLRELADLGVRRVSTGGALARVALAAFRTAAVDLAERGSFSGLWAYPDVPSPDEPFTR